MRIINITTLVIAYMQYPWEPDQSLKSFTKFVTPPFLHWSPIPDKKFQTQNQYRKFMVDYQVILHRSSILSKTCIQSEYHTTFILQ